MVRLMKCFVDTRVGPGLLGEAEHEDAPSAQILLSGVGEVLIAFFVVSAAVGSFGIVAAIFAPQWWQKLWGAGLTSWAVALAWLASAILSR
jgi:hypothetical protein